MKTLVIKICLMVALFAGFVNADIMTWETWIQTDSEIPTFLPDSYIGNNPEIPLARHYSCGTPVEVWDIFYANTLYDNTDILKVNQSGLTFQLPGELVGTHVTMDIYYFDRYTLLITTSMQETSYAWDSGWVTAQYEFDVTGSSDFLVYLEFTEYPTDNFPTYGPYIDSISFETAAIPEPATLALLGLGGLFLRKK